MTTLIPRLLAGLSVFGLLLTGCVSQAICAKQEECASDPPGRDFERICQIRFDGELERLRVNKEDECHEVARTLELYASCTSQLDCDDFNEFDHNGECDDERDDYADALDDADDECSARD